MCVVCKCDEATINYPFDHFKNPDFGDMSIQAFRLCEHCDDLFRHNHIALLAQEAIIGSARGAGSPEKAAYILGNSFMLADVYHLLTQFNLNAKIRLN